MYFYLNTALTKVFAIIFVFGKFICSICIYMCNKTQREDLDGRGNSRERNRRATAIQVGKMDGMMGIDMV